MHFSSSVLVVLSVFASADAFVTPQSHGASTFVRSAPPQPLCAQKNWFNPMEQELESMQQMKEVKSAEVPTSAKVAAMSAAVWASTSTASMAAGPDWGIFEGRIGSMLHPITMFGLLATSLYTAFLGFQWRRLRTIGDDIKALQKTIPDLGDSKTVSDALAAAKESGDANASQMAALEAAKGTESEISALQAERKDLVAAGPRDQHFLQGALLAAIGTMFAIEGPLNTYARAGKLFPGPHLYAGAGLVAVWALAVATVPFMQKGNDTARTVHIGANLGGIALFAWQVSSGIPIMQKVIEKTSFP